MMILNNRCASFFFFIRKAINLDKRFKLKCSSFAVTNQEQNVEEENYFMDARRKVPLGPNQKVKFTDSIAEDKIIYNSVIDGMKDRSNFLKRVKKYTKISSVETTKRKEQLLSKEVDSVIASRLMSHQHCGEQQQQNDSVQERTSDFSLPFSSYTPINQNLEKIQSELRELHLSASVNHGQQDPTIPVSEVPCGGCGALLHCQNSSIPGFISSEIMLECSKHDLRGQICQRCRLFREHDIALKVNVSPEDYIEVISVIKDQTAMVVLVVDLLDFPGSIWPNLLSLIGTKRPVYIVGNKVDLLPKDSKNYLKHIEQCLLNELEKSGLTRANIKHVSLVSAKTGYGIESMITTIQQHWGFRGDVYLLGCTNVGKSSLFNALINSDFCKTQAIDLLERATVSTWPGTTLNLLKFPMLRPTSIRLYERTKRLIAERSLHQKEEELTKENLRKTRNPSLATLTGYVGRTFSKNVEEPMDSFSVRGNTMPGGTVGKHFNPNHKDFAASKWCYDTPGTINSNQILTLLTLEELTKTLPGSLIRPRTLLLRPGVAYFLAGLARIDYHEGPHSLLITTFSSHQLPITLVSLNDADEMYKELMGSKLLGVPCGSAHRLKEWPGLTSSSLTITGKGWKESAADITLSSAGWVAVTGEKEREYKLEVHTPLNRGIHVRTPSLLPHAVMLRGARLDSSPAFRNNGLFLK